MCLESMSYVIFIGGAGVSIFFLFCDYGGMYCCEVSLYVLF